MDPSAAPGELEQVRSLLNTWWIPNDTRRIEDDLDALARDEKRWSRALPSVPPPSRSGLARLRSLRDQLRAHLGVSHPTALAPLLDAERWRIELAAPGTDPAARLVPDRRTTTSALLAIVVEAIATGRWHRLRACPDCGWVFYDSSRNGRRTWCSMTAAGGARGCGSIAKTRAYRARRAGSRDRRLTA